jgi:adenylosuccinate lyase
MIERYTNPEMGAVWDEENKFRKQLDVELAVCRARYEVGEIPEDDWMAIRDKADFQLERINEIEKTVDHETIALLTAVAEYVGTASRHIHAGMTSSDVLDTSFALQLVEAADILLRLLDELISVVGKRAVEFKHTIMMGRTHGVHAEPITFGLKLAIWYEELNRAKARLERAREAVRVGKISGTVGTYALISPEIEAKALGFLNLNIAPVSNQVIQRDRYADTCNVHREVRHRDTRAREDRGRRGDGAVSEGTERLIRDAAQT